MGLHDIFARAHPFETLTNPTLSLLEQARQASVTDRIVFHAGRDALELITKNINPVLGTEWVTEMQRRYKSTSASAQLGSLSEYFVSGLAIAQREGLADTLQTASEKIDQQRSRASKLPALDGAIQSVVEELRHSTDLAQIGGFARHLSAHSVSEILNSTALEKWLSKTLPSETLTALVESSLDDIWAELKTRDGVPATHEHTSSEFHARGRATVSFIGTVEPQAAEHGSRHLQSIPTIILALLIAFWSVLTGWEDARKGLVDISARLPNTESYFELKNFVRTELDGRPGDYRLIAGVNVNLREGPTMKSEILLTMPKYAVVLVLGKKDRTWRLVSYEHHGVWVDGYVSTKFLKKVKRDRSAGF